MLTIEVLKPAGCTDHELAVVMCVTAIEAKSGTQIHELVMTRFPGFLSFSMWHRFGCGA